MKNTEAKLRSNCEDLWSDCVDRKCNVPARRQACVKDSDCQKSCTEYATGETGLLSCCLTKPKHNNPCPTKIGNKCVQPGDFPFRGGQKLIEGDTPPDNTPRDGDRDIQIRPDTNGKYPEGTTFDEYGRPSLPREPMPDARGRVIDPDSEEMTRWRFDRFDTPQPNGGEKLPIEYEPEIPYKPWTGERMIVQGSDGALYSKPYYSLYDDPSKMNPTYSTPQDAPYSGSPQTSNNGGSSGSTFSGEQPNPDPNPCSWSLWGWCLWH